MLSNFPHSRRFIPATLAIAALVAGGFNLGGPAAAADPATVPVAKIGADSPNGLVNGVYTALHGGLADDIAPLIDQSTPTSKAYSNYLRKLVLARTIPSNLLDKIAEMYGNDTAYKAYQLMAKPPSALEAKYWLSSKDDFKEGDRFPAPGFKGQCVIVKKDGRYLLDCSAVLEGVDMVFLKKEIDGYITLVQHYRDAAELAESADDLVTRLKAVKE